MNNSEWQVVQLKEGVRISGLIYYSILITCGTIGNVLSLLVIRGVGNTYNFKRTYVFTKNGRVKCHTPENTQNNAAYTNVNVNNTHDQLYRWDNYRGFESASSNENPKQTAQFQRSIKCRRRASLGVFTALAIADTIALWINPVRYVIYYAFDYDIRTQISHHMCKLHAFFTYASRDCATWVLCLLTLERFLIACFPYKAQLIWHGWKKYIVWFFVNFLLLAKNSIILFKLSLTKNSLNKEICDTEDVTIRKIFFHLDLIFYSIVPTLMLFILNLGLLKILQKASAMHRYTWSDNLVMKTINKGKTRNSLILNCYNRISTRLRSSKTDTQENIDEASYQKSRRMDRSSQQATHLLIPVSLFHLMTSIPLCIFSILEDFKGWKKSSRDSNTSMIVFAVGQLLVMLASSNHGVNCLLYFLSSRNFRKRLCFLLKVSSVPKQCSKCKKRCAKPKQRTMSGKSTLSMLSKTPPRQNSKRILTANNWRINRDFNSTTKNCEQFNLECWTRENPHHIATCGSHYDSPEINNEKLLSIHNCTCHKSPSCYIANTAPLNWNNSSPTKKTATDSSNPNNIESTSTYSVNQLDDIN